MGRSEVVTARIAIKDTTLKPTQVIFTNGTSDFLTGLMESPEKMAWMIRSHLH